MNQEAESQQSGDSRKIQEHAKWRFSWSSSLMNQGNRHSPSLHVHTAVLNDTLGDSFCRRQPGVRLTNDDGVAAAAT
jgi:hypothetical protein